MNIPSVYVAYALKFVKNVVRSVLNTSTITAGSVLKHATDVLKNAARWLHNFLLVEFLPGKKAPYWALFCLYNLIPYQCLNSRLKECNKLL